MSADSLANQLKHKGKYKDLGEYNVLKESHEKEVHATHKLYEHLRQQHGDAAARAKLREKGYDPDLLA